MTVYNYGKWQSGSGWQVETLLNKANIPNYEAFIVDVKPMDANHTIDSLVELTTGDGDAGDLNESVIATDESVVVAATIINDEHNRNILAVDNDEDSYYSLDKSTATFSDRSSTDDGYRLHALILMPGMILNIKLADSNAIAILDSVCCGGSGKVKNFVDGTDADGARLGKSLSVATSVASLQYISMMVTR